jgi:uncharacterized delta-60 repeat protein
MLRHEGTGGLVVWSGNDRAGKLRRAADEGRAALWYSLEPLEARVLLSAGDLDPTFGAGGKIVTDLGVRWADAAVLQGDGKLVVVAGGDDLDFHKLMRYNADGSVDTTFGASGLAGIDLGYHISAIEGLAVTADGKIIIAASVYDEQAKQAGYVVARFNADGSADLSFGDGGFFRELYSIDYPPDDRARIVGHGASPLQLQADGKIVLALVHRDGFDDANIDARVVRLTADGQLDATFGTGGVVTLDIDGTSELTRDLAIAPDGKIVVVLNEGQEVFDGEWYTLDQRRVWVVRLNTDGSRDGTFGTGGVVTESTPTGILQAQAVAVDDDGRVLLILESTDASAQRNAGSLLVRFNADGTRDTTLGGGDGQVELAYNTAQFTDVVAAPEGKILLAGGIEEPRTGEDRGWTGMMSRRLNADGSLDASYGDNGTTRVEFDHDGHYSFGRYTLIQPDGRILVIGMTNQPDNGADLAMIRLEGDAVPTAPPPATGGDSGGDDEGSDTPGGDGGSDGEDESVVTPPAQGEGLESADRIIDGLQPAAVNLFGSREIDGDEELLG